MLLESLASGMHCACVPQAYYGALSLGLLTALGQKHSQVCAAQVACTCPNLTLCWCLALCDIRTVLAV